MRGNFEEYIEKCKIVHHNKYDYSKAVEPRTTSDNITIICPVHGEFQQLLKNHLQGYGCKKCGRIVVSIKEKSKSEEVIEKCKKSKYGKDVIFDKFIYNGMHKYSTFICPIHGDFKAEPSNFIKGHGCPKCGNDRIKKIKTYDTATYINKAIKIYGNNRYGYWKTNYIDCYTPIVIWCYKCHKYFKQIPYIHLQHHGCQFCNETLIEEEVEKLLQCSKINYIYQQRYNWLGQQSLDFYISEYNVAIECQGEQHFKSVEFFGGDDGLAKTIQRDNLKKKLCEENGVKLLYFSNLGIEYPYKVFEDKDELLKEIINSK